MGWEALTIRVTKIGNGVVVGVAAGKDYADTALPDMHFPTLQAGLEYAVEKAADPDAIIGSGKPAEEYPPF